MDYVQHSRTVAEIDAILDDVEASKGQETSLEAKISALESAISAVSGRLDVISFEKISKSDYDALPVKAQDTVYYVYNDSGKIEPHYSEQDIGGNSGVGLSAIISRGVSAQVAGIAEEVQE